VLGFGSMAILYGVGRWKKTSKKTGTRLDKSVFYTCFAGLYEVKVLTWLGFPSGTFAPSPGFQQCWSSRRAPSSPTWWRSIPGEPLPCCRGVKCDVFPDIVMRIRVLSMLDLRVLLGVTYFTLTGAGSFLASYRIPKIGKIPSGFLVFPVYHLTADEFTTLVSLLLFAWRAACLKCVKPSVLFVRCDAMRSEAKEGQITAGRTGGIPIDDDADLGAVCR
jgi:hypothetical protein